MAIKHINQAFDNSDYNPVMAKRSRSVIDQLTLKETIIEEEVPEPLGAEDIAKAQQNLNYRRAAVAAEHLSALGLQTSLNLNSLTFTLNGGSQLIEGEG